MIFWGTAVWCRQILITFTKSRKKLESRYRFWSNIVLFSLDRFLFKREFATRGGDGRLPQRHFSLPTEQWRADQNPPRWALPADSSQRGRHLQREPGHAGGSGTPTQHCALCYPAGLEGPELLLSPLLPSPRQDGFDSEQHVRPFLRHANIHSFLFRRDNLRPDFWNLPLKILPVVPEVLSSFRPERLHEREKRHKAARGSLGEFAVLSHPVGGPWWRSAVLAQGARRAGRGCPQAFGRTPARASRKPSAAMQAVNGTGGQERSRGQR